MVKHNFNAPISIARLNHQKSRRGVYVDEDPYCQWTGRNENDHLRVT